MPSKSLIQYSEKTLVIADDLIKMGKLLPDVKGHEPITIFEAIFYIFGQIDEGLGDGNEQITTYNNLIKQTKESLRDLPVFYHIQILRQFINRYYTELLGQKISQKNNSKYLESIIAVTNSLVAETDKTIEKTGIILSPIEIIYLYVDSFISEEPIADEHEAEAFKTVLSNISIQGSVVLSYLSRYEDKYQKALKQEVLNG